MLLIQWTKFCFFILCTSIAFALPQINTEQTTFQKIQQLRQQNQLPEAQVLAQTYLLQHPNDLDVLLLSGLIDNQQQKYERAMLSFQQILLERPDYLDARLGLIHSLMALQRPLSAQALIEDALVLKPFDSQLLEAQRLVKNQLASQEKKPTKTAVDLASIQKLRAENHLDKAQGLALDELKKHPGDADLLLVTGLIFGQKKDYEPARFYLQQVLAKVPAYMEARIALIQILRAEKKEAEAKKMLHEGLELNPNAKALLKLEQQMRPAKRLRRRVRVINRELEEAKKAQREGRFDTAIALYRQLLQKNPGDVSLRLAWADLYLARHLDQNALCLIRQGLRQNPNNLQLLLKLAEIQTLMRLYSRAAHTGEITLDLYPNNKQAKGVLKEIAAISPRYLYGLNEVGASTSNSYVSDLHSVWDLSSVWYTHFSNFGRIGGRVNYASRLGFKAPQYELDFSPVWNRNLYMDFVAAWSDQPVLFPRQLYGGEAYLNVSKRWQLSLGGRHSYLGQTFFNTLTGSLNFYPNHYWLAFRPYYYFSKNHRTSLLYTANIRRYFESDDHFIGLAAGSGTSPDLADLQLANFIVIRNNFVNLTYEFPLFNHCWVVDLGAGYTRWVYPNGLLRNLYEGNLALKYRF